MSHTRPDITFSVSVVSQFMHSPYEEHLEVVHRILRYLKATPGKGLFFKKTDQRRIEVFTDEIRLVQLLIEDPPQDIVLLFGEIW